MHPNTPTASEQVETEVLYPSSRHPLNMPLLRFARKERKSSRAKKLQDKSWSARLGYINQRLTKHEESQL